jgi:hypothetical protein
MMIAAFGLSLDHPYAEEAFEANEKNYLIKLKEREEVLQEEFNVDEKEQWEKYRLRKSSKCLDDWLDNVLLHIAVVTNPKATL